MDSIISGFGDLSNKISYTTDVTSTLTSAFDIVNKDYVDTAVAGAGAGFDVSNAPIIRYVNTVENAVISSDPFNLVTVDWVQSNANVGDIYELSRLD